MSANRIDPWLELTEEIGRLQAEHPMADAVVAEIEGRRMRVGDRWLTDFASCNYLGFDLDPEIQRGVPEHLRRWGTHPSWARSIASPALNEEIEHELRALLGAEDVLTLPTLTLMHHSVLPALARTGTVLVDMRAHKSIHDGALVARARGATVRRYRHDDPERLERLLRGPLPHPRLVCMDGINSTTGNPPDLPALLDLANTYDALLYVDDAHGFGVIGERSASDPTPYGRRGNAVVRYFDAPYDRVLLCSGFSKAYSSLLAFIACSSAVKRALKATAAPYTYSGPSPVASLATALLGLEANARRGDDLRLQLYRRTRRVLDHLEARGITVSNTSGFPIVELALHDADDLDAAGRYLFDHGIFVMLMPYPIVPRRDVGFRIQVTATNTDAQITHLLDVLDGLDEVFGLRRWIPEEPELLVAPAL